MASPSEKRATYPRCKRARQGPQNYMAIENYNIYIIIKNPLIQDLEK